MKSYRESFSPGDGRRGLTQEELLRRMAEVDSDYGERFSHATVSRWESGLTRPAVDRLRIFGRAFDLSDTETAGLILLAGLAPDFRTAAEQVNLAVGHDGDEYQGSAEQDSGFDFMTRDEVAGAEHESSLLKGVLRLAFVRCPLMGFGIVGGGYALALLGGARPGCLRRMSRSRLHWFWDRVSCFLIEKRGSGSSFGCRFSSC